MRIKSAKGVVTHYNDDGKLVSTRKLDVKWAVQDGMRVSPEAAKPRRKRRKAS